MKTTLQSIYRYNFREDLFGHSNAQRIYALEDEAGLLLCTWPRGGRPDLPFVYCDEVWTGIEYQVAGHMIYEGLVEEGLTIVKGLRARYDGNRRNPWNELECGSHYARAMASWSLLLALSGFSCDLTKGMLAFKPALAERPFRCFWSTGTAWGEYEQTESQVTLRCEYGQQTVKTLRLGNFKAAAATINGTAVKVTISAEGDGSVIEFESPVTVQAGQALALSNA